MENAASYYGKLSVRYFPDLIREQITVLIDSSSPELLPEFLEIRMNHPTGKNIKIAVCNDVPQSEAVAGSGNILIRPDDFKFRGRFMVVAYY